MGLGDILHSRRRRKPGHGKPKPQKVFSRKGVAPGAGSRTLKGLQEKPGKSIEEFHALAKMERHEAWKRRARKKAA